MSTLSVVLIEVRTMTLVNIINITLQYDCKRTNNLRGTEVRLTTGLLEFFCKFFEQKQKDYFFGTDHEHH